MDGQSRPREGGDHFRASAATRDERNAADGRDAAPD